MKENKMKVIYIFGSGRSGTTLLTILLNSMNNSIAVGELSNYIDRNGIPFSDNKNIIKFWAEVFKEFDNLNKFNQIIFKKVHNYEDNRYLLKHLFFKKSFNYKEYKNYIFNLLLSIKDISNKNIIIDSSKSITKAYLINYLFKKNKEIDFYFINLIRSPFGVINSNMKNNANTFIKSLFRYVVITILSEFLKIILPNGKKITIRYEDIIFNSKNVFEKISILINEDLEIIKKKIYYNKPFFTGYLFGGNIIKNKKQIYLKKTIEKTNLNIIQKIIISIFTLPFLIKYNYLKNNI